MRSRGQVELHPFDPKLKRTLHRLRREQREAQHRNPVIMQNNVEQDHGQSKRSHNGNNGRNQAPRPFIQPNDPFMLL